MSFESFLGKQTQYPNQYTPSLLCPIPRSLGRDKIFQKKSPLPFYGADIWNHYEVSWLDENGKPTIALAEIIIPCDSENLIESKSLKLYFNGFNQTKIPSKEIFIHTVQQDLSNAVKAPVLFSLGSFETLLKKQSPLFSGICLDNLAVSCDAYEVNPKFLTTTEVYVKETIHSHLLKSNCLVTGQPDWASLQISYEGHQINPAGLLKYIVSYREHQGFHEECVERIFADIMEQCHPKTLSVFANYTRRGGIDINPFRTNQKNDPLPENPRLLR